MSNIKLKLRDFFQNSQKFIYRNAIHKLDFGHQKSEQKEKWTI